jgi:3-oxoacyl-[acyl-carrier-protein] synthase I
MARRYRVEAVDDITAPVERLIQLADLALEPGVMAWAMARGLDPAAALDGMPVLLSLPAERPGLPAAALDWIGSALLDDLGPFDRTRSGAVRIGHDGFAALLEVAAGLVATGDVPAVLVGALDSSVDPGCVAWLEDAGRLRSPGRANGMAPGEGAAFCVVTRPSALVDADVPFIGLSSMARAQEPHPWYCGRPTIGEGLSAAVRQALKAGPVDVCYADLNGEIWRSAEWDFAYLRNGKHFAHPLDIRHPAECWGDTGAASGALLLLLAAWDLWQGRSLHRAALVCTSSATQPSRAAIRLQLPTAARAAFAA